METKLMMFTLGNVNSLEELTIVMFHKVTTSTVSQAFYLGIAAGELHQVVVLPLSRSIPVQVLVLDDPLGQS